MSKGKRIALILVAVLIVIVGGLAIIVPMLFNVDRYRTQVAAQIQEQTGKPVQIGHLALTVLPQVAIRVDNFSLGNPEGFPAGNVVSAKKIYAVVDATALWHRQVEIKSLELDDLTLDMLEDAHGKWNFENPPPQAAPPKNASANSGPAVSLGVISKLTIKDGEFSAANLLPSGDPGPALMKVQGAEFDLRQVDLKALSTTSHLQGGPAPDNPSLLSALLPGWLTAVVYAADPTGPPVAQGTVQADALDFADISVTKMQSKVRLYPKKVFVDDLELKCYGGTGTGNLSLDLGEANLSYSVDAKLKGVDVEQFLSAFPQAKGMMTGTMDGTAKLSGAVLKSPDPLAAITGAGQASIRNGRMPSLQLGSNLRTLTRMASVGPTNGDPSSFSSLSADFSISGGKLTSRKINLVSNGVDVDASGSMTMAGEGTLDYQGDASLASDGSNPLGAILGGLAGARTENGKLIFPFAVAGTFAKPKFSLKGQGGAAGVPKDAAEEPVNAVRDLGSLFKKRKSQ